MNRVRNDYRHGFRYSTLKLTGKSQDLGLHEKLCQNAFNTFCMHGLYLHLVKVSEPLVLLVN